MEFKKEIADKTFRFQIDKLAEQANGSVFCRLGDTVVLATVTMSSQDIENLEFFPLTVEFEEKYYAAGKILGSRFVRREGKPTEEAILTARLIDRPIRPLFDPDLKREVQVIVTCHSFDEENDPDICGILSTSLALGISDIPWNGPVGAVRVAKIKDKFVFNPTYQEREEADFELTVCGVKDGEEILINMLEGGAQEIGEKEILKAISLAKEKIKKLIEFQEKIIQEYGKPKIQVTKEEDLELEQALKNQFSKTLEEVLFTYQKLERKQELQEIGKNIEEFVAEKFGEEKVPLAKKFIKNELKRILTEKILKEEKRPDGRKLDEIRPIEAQVGILPRTHGSALFIRGLTKSLSTVTLGSPNEYKLIEGMEVRSKKRFMHHYNFPPYCAGEIKPLRGPSRREIGHGALVEKALTPLVPDFDEFPYTIRVVSEILSSNGSTSMASVSSSSLALMDAGVPIKRPAAGIAIGIVQDGQNYKLLTDIQGPEDHFGGMDFKVAGTEKGITAIQLDVKIRGLKEEIIQEVFERAKKARLQILEITNKVLAKPRESLSPFAPKVLSIKIDPEKIAQVIGPGGRTINEIIGKCEVSIDIEPDGHIYITSQSKEAVQKAADWIRNLTREIKVGERFKGKVKRILDFGAIVEVVPEREGLLHISQIAPFKIKRISDVIKVGDIIPVEVIDLDELGRPRLRLLKRITPPHKSSRSRKSSSTFKKHK